MGEPTADRTRPDRDRTASRTNPAIALLCLLGLLLLPALPGCSPAASGPQGADGQESAAGTESAAGPEGADPAADRDPAAVELLRQTRAAILAQRTFRYSFEMGAAESRWGWVNGQASLQRGEDVTGSKMRIAGTFHPQPLFDRQGRSFVYARDEQWAREERQPEGVLASASLRDSPTAAAGLAGNAAYGLLADLVAAEPLHLELKRAAQLRLLPPEPVEGTLCDVVEARFDDPSGTTVRWYLARTDRLPRAQHWSYTARGREWDLPFTVSDLTAGVELPPEIFELNPSPGTESEQAATEALRIGQPLPGWSLARMTDDEGAGTATADLADYRGKVVAMVFWNTGCVICHSVLPDLERLAQRLPDDAEMVAINFYEPGDPVAYWQQKGYSMPLLLDGDEVAASYQIAGQPAVVVADREGALLYAQVGIGFDRLNRIEAAIERGVAAR